MSIGESVSNVLWSAGRAVRRWRLTAGAVQLLDQAIERAISALIMGREKTSNPVLPFFHLRPEGFWHLVPVPGKEEASGIDC